MKISKKQNLFIFSLLSLFCIQSSTVVKPMLNNDDEQKEQESRKKRRREPICVSNQSSYDQFREIIKNARREAQKIADEAATEATTMEKPIEKKRKIDKKLSPSPYYPIITLQPCKPNKTKNHTLNEPETILGDLYYENMIPNTPGNEIEENEDLILQKLLREAIEYNCYKKQRSEEWFKTTTNKYGKQWANEMLEAKKRQLVCWKNNSEQHFITTIKDPQNNESDYDVYLIFLNNHYYLIFKKSILIPLTLYKDENNAFTEEKPYFSKPLSQDELEHLRRFYYSKYSF